MKSRKPLSVILLFCMIVGLSTSLPTNIVYAAVNDIVIGNEATDITISYDDSTGTYTGYGYINSSDVNVKLANKDITIKSDAGIIINSRLANAGSGETLILSAPNGITLNANLDFPFGKIIVSLGDLILGDNINIVCGEVFRFINIDLNGHSLVLPLHPQQFYGSITGSGAISGSGAENLGIAGTYVNGVKQKEVASYNPLGMVTLAVDEHITDLTALKSSGKLPVTVIVTDGANPSSAGITGWTGNYDGINTGTYTLTAVWTMPSGYIDDVSPIIITIDINVTTAQTSTPTEIVATPAATPAGGTYATAQTVTFACATSGVSIYYTTDGTTPTTGSVLYASGSSINVPMGTTLKAYATAQGMIDSAVMSETYTQMETVATPAATPAGETYATAQAVTLSCATSGASIYYTTDGTMPTIGSALYASGSPISISMGTTLKAYATALDMIDSAVMTETYTRSGSSSSGGSSTTYYTVTFNTDGGSTVSSKSVAKNSTVTAPTNPTKAGYTFTSWYTDKALTEKYNFATKVTGSFTLYAGWQKIAESDTGDTKTHSAYISGYGNGTFRPNNSMTRAETATLFYNLLENTGVSGGSFTDVSSGAWYYDAVIALSGRGIISGYEDGSFRPDATITRAEFTSMTMRFANISSGTGSVSFSDVDSRHWAYGMISTAAKNGYVSGYSDGTFRPDGLVTRAEAVTIVNRIRGCVGIAGGMNFTDISTGHWAYEAITAAATDHTHE